MSSSLKGREYRGTWCLDGLEGPVAFATSHGLGSTALPFPSALRQALGDHCDVRAGYVSG